MIVIQRGGDIFFGRVVWRGWMRNDPHNIKTFIGAEEWKVVKCLLLAVNSFSIQCTRSRCESKKTQAYCETVCLCVN